MRRAVRLDYWSSALIGLALFAFVLRFVSADQQSAYMDEGTNLLAGRLLVEQGIVYAEILNWAYGSYLWPLVAGGADALGGLRLVRATTALFGVIMTLATALAAYRLASPAISASRRRAVALVAGLIMALAPGAIGVGRFGTYDAMAAAAFMLGLSLVVPPESRPRHLWLFAAAALLFVAFLAKYLVAIYFPFICLYVLLAPIVRAPRRIAVTSHHLASFVLPLTVACAAYLLIFLGPLLTLLTSSLSYGDLKSHDPLKEYVWSRPEIWVLLGAAAIGWRLGTPTGRLAAVVGGGIIAGFQLIARPDFDFWKHSVYLVYFLAPLAALTWLKIPQTTGTWRVVAVTGVIAAAAGLAPRAGTAASEVVAFYPNLNPSLATIERYASSAATVLMDDTALRYYLYGKVPIDGLVGPFSFHYQGQDGLDAYRSAIYDHYFDVIVLNGGVTPPGAAIKQNLAQPIDENYTRVSSESGGHRFAVDVYRPNSAREGLGSEASGPWLVRYAFETDASLENWGAHPEGRTLEPGRQVAISGDQLWNGRPSLQFIVEENASTVAVHHSGTVTAVRAHVYLVPTNESGQPVRVGMVGFDADWAWRDDGYRWLVPPGVWTTVKWQLPRAGPYHEIALSFPKQVRVAYIGDLEIEP